METRKSLGKERARFRMYLKEDEYNGIKQVAKQKNYSMSLVLGEVIQELIKERLNEKPLRESNKMKKSSHRVGHQKRLHIYLLKSELDKLNEISERLKYARTYLIRNQLKYYLERELKK